MDPLPKCIVFSELKGFPPINGDEKINTSQFLDAASEVVDIISRFGVFFTPIVKDIHGNIKKLRSVYEKDQQSHKFLEDLIALNVDKDNNRVGDALLWLSRSLQLICTFFENICQDKECLQTLKLQLKDAYERTLKPYHGLILQNTIKVIYSRVPTRADLLGHDKLHDENLQLLSSKYLPSLRNHLVRIENLLNYHDLNNDKKV